MRKVLIPTKLDKFAATMLSDRGYNVVLDGATPLADLVKANSDAEVLIVRSEKITPEIIDLLPNLKLIVRAGAGYNTIDTKYARKHDIRCDEHAGREFQRRGRRGRRHDARPPAAMSSRPISRRARATGRRASSWAAS